MAPQPHEIVRGLVTDPPSFHWSGTRNWNAGEPLLEYLARTVRPGLRTVETGAGASTVVFAACGAVHTAISPAADEHQLISHYCVQQGVSIAEVDFIASASEAALPGFAAEPGAIDLFLIDGKHSFPMPVVDFHHAWRLLKVGGVLIIDDIPIRSVQLVHDFCAGSEAWQLLEILDGQSSVFRKVADEDPWDHWNRHPMNRKYPDLRFLPLRGRVIAATRDRAIGVARVLLRDRFPRLWDYCRRRIKRT